MNQSIKSSLTETYMGKRLHLKKFLSARLGSVEEAEDIVQDLFLKLQKMQVPDDIRSPEAFLYKIAYNLALDRLRQRQRSSAREEKWVEESHQKIGPEWVSDEPSAEARVDSQLRLKQLVAAVQNLPPQARRVFILHKFDGLTHREVAEKLKISPSTVEKHMINALKRLAHLRRPDDT